MGKKGRKTRWRTLTITDERSDSEESNSTTAGHRAPKGYPQKSYYGRFTYSSQSTPTRRYQDGTKSTRSSSTASENKITFNEDEYTRITTPRQDVLFKKGYLNKPKMYQTQTSTGNSTTSTGNSTGNGTPDHQSTDLEYESQFVFPNGFVDQNGIYYVNSFEPYPVMVFNPPTYYAEYASCNNKTKRCSTDSLTEATSPQNEEAGQNETPSHVSDSKSVECHKETDAEKARDPTEPRRAKRRRRRKPPNEEEAASSDDVLSEEDDDEQRPEATEERSQSPRAMAKYDLKPDAEEFVPRAYRHQPEAAVPVEPPNVQFIKFPPNFVPVPILNPIEFNAFMGYPINFVPPNYVSFVPYKSGPNVQIEEEGKEEAKEEISRPNQIDIAKIVSKLEQAAKEQEDEIAAVKEESKNVCSRKKHKFQKVDLRSPEKKPPSPKREEQQPQKPLRIYAETLKRSMNVQKCERQTERTKNNKMEPKERVVSNHRRIEQTQPKLANEWISVASRKKRKNKNLEENEEVVAKNEEEIALATEDQRKEETVVSNEVVVEKAVQSSPPPPSPPPETVENKIEEVKKPKKKTKKNHVKTSTQITKRVIVKDIDLSVDESEKNVEELTEAVNDESKVKKEEVVDSKEEVIGVEMEVEEVPLKEEEEEEQEKKIIEEVVQTEKKESPEKKSKKKKKKPAKNAMSSDQSDSSTTLNTTDDSYDFLLNESTEKTNVEVSQELDKMIQRGMYISLEEKIKSMNIDSNENFFKTIISNISSVETNPHIKNPDFSKLLTNTDLMKPLPRTKPSNFLAEGAPVRNGGKTEENLYPITRAVKEWMTKTREQTPDVEIFKSPSTIFREFEDVEGNERKSSVSSIEEGEDVLDGLKVDEEIGKAYPKHGNLPYRAICCSIM